MLRNWSAQPDPASFKRGNAQKKERVVWNGE